MLILGFLEFWKLITFGCLQLAFEAHDGQKRKSGEPFIIHPVEVARILGELVLNIILTLFVTFFGASSKILGSTWLSFF